MNAFKKLGCDNIGIIDISDRKGTIKKEYLQRIQACDAIVFSGGNQLCLSAIFGGTAFLKILLKRYVKEDFVLAGTSARAMALCNMIIYEGEASTAHLKGEVKITTGWVSLMISLLIPILRNVVASTVSDRKGTIKKEYLQPIRHALALD